MFTLFGNWLQRSEVDFGNKEYRESGLFKNSILVLKEVIELVNLTVNRRFIYKYRKKYKPEEFCFAVL